jgi:hypothetical protein
VETAAAMRAAAAEEEKEGAAMASAAPVAAEWAEEAGWAEGGGGPRSVGTAVSTGALGSKEGGAAAVVAQVGLPVVWRAVAVEAVEAAGAAAARVVGGTGAAGGVEVGWGATGPVVRVGAAEAMAVVAREGAVAAGG